MPWRCSSPMMRPAVQWSLCRGLLAFAVFGTGFAAAAAGAGAGLGVDPAAGAGVEMAEGRSTYFEDSLAGVVSLTLTVLIVPEIVAVTSWAGADSLAASDRLREPPAWADAVVKIVRDRAS